MTTNDPFADAARAEAKRRLSYHDKQWGDIMRPMLHMAEWGRDHALAQEPTDAEVEAVADVLAESEDTGSVETARAALSAARAARRDEEKR